MKLSTSPETAALVEAADRRRQRRTGTGLSWTSAPRALEWFYEAKERMSSPVGMHPRTSTAPGGAQVLIRVDGGKGGDLDEVMACIVSIGQTLAALHAWRPQAARAVELRHRDGLSLEKIGHELQVGPTAASKLLHEGESFCAGWLVNAGVVARAAG